MNKAERTPAQRESQFSQRKGVGGEKFLIRLRFLRLQEDRNWITAIWKFWGF